MSQSSIVIQGICYDEKSSYQRGMVKAPPLIRERLWSPAYNVYSEKGIAVTKDRIKDRGDFEPNDYWPIYEQTLSSLKNGERLLTFGGDHSITYPIYKAFSEKHGPATILHFDAHADLYDEFEGDIHSHACPFARIMESTAVTELIQVGIRTLTPHQREQAKKFNVRQFDCDNVQVPVEITGPIYISLDMDVFDPAFAPGVSHQEAAGLLPREVLRWIHSINGPVLGADIVEYNPANDQGGITAALAAKMAKEIMACMMSF